MKPLKNLNEFKSKFNLVYHCKIKLKPNLDIIVNIMKV